MSDDEDELTVDPQGDAVWSAHDGLPLLRTVASGVVRLSEIGHPGAFALPYPPDAQRALDRMILACLYRNQTAPASVPDLVAWCRELPVRSWPLDLPADAASDGDVLVDPVAHVPTQLCYEWALDVRDAASEQYERQLMSEVMDSCRAQSAPESYVAFRRLLVTQPVLTTADLTDLQANLDLFPVVELVKKVYLPAPLGYLRDSRFAGCARCRGLLVPTTTGGWWCEQDRCRTEGPARVGSEYPRDARGQVLLLARPLRMFITGPGRAEIELEAALTGCGLTVEMWPQYDAYDLRVHLPDGRIWALDVKDRANPALLGRAAQPFRSSPSFDEAFLVVPKYRLGQREDYKRVFAYHCPPEVAAQVRLVTDRELFASVRRLLPGRADGSRKKGGRRARS